ncbi:MAG: TIGR04283 family arsenosugar biosynthesis glycosyltransferase [Balneolaceae bacterium]|nr:TIGR04283 family arsenosugar biosynthesis glycosyltransferase [Balneolaceae bacterium]
MEISIIIPTFNEEGFILPTLKKIIENSSSKIKEIIISDGGSTDRTRKLVREFEMAKLVESPQKGRAAQMNYGASFAKGSILFFLHADTVPPIHFDKKIISEVEKGIDAGCFQLSFDWNHPFLKFYSWCTKFNVDAFRFGDQGLFISREIFQEIGGFHADYFLMEDHEIVRRIKKEYSFKIMAQKVITSARKYKKNGVVKLQLIFTLIYVFYHLKIPQEVLKNLYKELIK